MIQVEIISKSGNKYYCSDNTYKTPIGNAEHRVRSLVWSDGDFLLGGEEYSNRKPYVPLGNEGVLKLFPTERLARLFLKNTYLELAKKELGEDYPDIDKIPNIDFYISDNDIKLLKPQPLVIDMLDYFPVDDAILNNTSYVLCYNKYVRHIISYSSQITDKITIGTWKDNEYTSVDVKLNVTAFIYNVNTYIKDGDKNGELYWTLTTSINGTMSDIITSGQTGLFSGVNYKVSENLASSLISALMEPAQEFGTILTDQHQEIEYVMHPLSDNSVTSRDMGYVSYQPLAYYDNNYKLYYQVEGKTVDVYKIGTANASDYLYATRIIFYSSNGDIQTEYLSSLHNRLVHRLIKQVETDEHEVIATYVILRLNNPGSGSILYPNKPDICKQYLQKLKVSKSKINNLFAILK